MSTRSLIRLGSFAVTLSVCSIASAQEISKDAALAEVKGVLASYQAMFERDFVVKLVSPEVNKAFADKIARQSPVPVQLQGLLMRYKDGATKIKPKLGSIPPALRQIAEEKAMEVISASPIGKAVPQLTHKSVTDAIEFLLQQKDKMSVKKVTEENLDLEVTGLNEKAFDGLVIRTVRARVDRKKKLLSIVKFTFDQGKYLGAKLTYAPVKTPDGKTPFMHQKAIIIQDVFVNNPALPLPKKITLKYSDYRFSK
ncbi:MAG: hypothetical protein HN742_39985 [Lentisphaerae bacterium]|jgi:hypothetical protein|nr:hypothetical protein [Lentisphaerota bacterium]MBT4821509.1 hypothetical protein [Lentisphaerota bacterium]MBT5611317.1 hypothetical protein [Lentisphaerota bacterium]MBT7058157.1 hypothetical protein [Lentisphaerota bacterium]MBT7848117.1 hypothetical protein [Lentisphaerota bacterium]